MKAVGTEFEAHGFGLIVAAVAVLMVAAVLSLSAITATNGLGWVVGRIKQHEPVTPVRPPPA